MSVVLADDERVRRAASSPCGSGNVENGDGSGSSCFFAGLATGLRLDGLDGSLALAIAVRAVTTGGPGPLSAPVVTSPASLSLEDPPVKDEDPAEEPGESPPGESPPGDASSVDGVVPSEAPRPDAPALDSTAVPDVVRVPLDEANWVGGVYEQMNNDYDNANGQGSGTAAFDAGGDFVEESTTEEVVGGGLGGLGYGAYGGGFGYPFAGLGFGGLGFGGYRDGFYGDGFYGGGGGGNGTSVVVGGSTVTIVLNVASHDVHGERDDDADAGPVPYPIRIPGPVASPFAVSSGPGTEEEGH